MYFRLRGGNEHHKMKRGDDVLERNEKFQLDNLEYNKRPQKQELV